MHLTAEYALRNLLEISNLTNNDQAQAQLNLNTDANISAVGEFAHQNIDKTQILLWSSDKTGAGKTQTTGDR